MKVLVPCKLGERFTPFKFDDWIGNNRVYTRQKPCEFIGISIFLFNTHCLSVPTIHTTAKSMLQYDKELGFMEFVPTLQMDIPDRMFRDESLSEKGINSKRTGRFCGLSYENGKVMADFTVKPNYEHLKFEYPEELKYLYLDKEIKSERMFKFRFEKENVVDTVYKQGG